MPIGRDCISEHLGNDLHLEAPNSWFAVQLARKKTATKQNILQLKCGRTRNWIRIALKKTRPGEIQKSIKSTASTAWQTPETWATLAPHTTHSKQLYEAIYTDGRVEEGAENWIRNELDTGSKTGREMFIRLVGLLAETCKDLMQQRDEAKSKSGDKAEVKDDVKGGKKNKAEKSEKAK